VFVALTTYLLLLFFAARCFESPFLDGLLSYSLYLTAILSISVLITCSWKYLP
jgi:hypothetical protein